jgi:sulfite dehydrogenase
MKSRRRPSRWLSLLVLAAAAAAAAPVEITLPAEPGRLLESPLPGYALATTWCYTCHSSEYIRYQPVSARAYWKATVEKMQKTFGAPLPDEALEPIVDYLVKTYGAERGGAAPTVTGAIPGKPLAAPGK